MASGMHDGYVLGNPAALPVLCLPSKLGVTKGLNLRDTVRKGNREVLGPSHCLRERFGDRTSAFIG